MKQAVVYYSFDGNTKNVAESIAKKSGADVFRLIEVKKRPVGPKAVIGGGFQAFFGVTTKLKNNFAEELSSYDKIFIGTPIWAGKVSPAAAGFAKRLNVNGKSICIFTLQASDVDEDPCKAAKKLAEKLKEKGAADVKAVSFKGAGIDDCISDDSAQEMVEQKLQF